MFEIKNIQQLSDSKLDIYRDHFANKNNPGKFRKKYNYLPQRILTSNASLFKNRRFIEDSSAIKKAGCIILNKELTHIVLVKNRMSFEKGENKYGLSKGSIHKDESFLEAARREVYEETGLQVSINAKNSYVIIDDIIYYIVFIQRKSNLQFFPVDHNEVLSAEWISLKKVKLLNMNRSLYKFIYTKLY
jgi:8-oxo-dGTP pyrophosphatase MutT (NUDIX family)